MSRSRDISNLLGAGSVILSGAPSALDTLDELAAALGDDANYASTVTTALNNRVLKTGGDTITVSSGTTVPLTIQNNGTGNSFVVNDGASDTTPFIIDADGNIGIGNAPGDFSSRLLVLTPNGTASRFTLGQAGITNYSWQIPASTDAITLVYGASTERMRIDSSGNVGINEVSPNSLLELTKSSSGGTVSGNPFVVLSNRNNTNSSFVVGGIVSDTYRDIADPHYSAGIWFTREPFSGNFSSSGSIVFGAQFNTSTGSLPIERMRIDYDGRVKLPAGGILEAPVSTNAQTGTGYTLVLTDAGRVIEMNNAAANTLTVPTDASVNFPVGTVIDIFQTGAGQTTVGGAGVTINARPGLKLSGQWATATLIKRAANTWLLTGSLSA